MLSGRQSGVPGRLPDDHGKFADEEYKWQQEEAEMQAAARRRDWKMAEHQRQQGSPAGGNSGISFHPADE